MDYVILNGVNSNTITGLLISKLPPISKPLMRTQIEEIDGRDGDIITELGYSAYDKEVEIGLRGNFNVNQVIAYFATEGQVIFSNEPDKYYRYKIIDQVDYEKLLRFRTATVTFHVQPYKYSATETVVSATSFPATVTNSGNTISKPKITIYGSNNITISVNGNLLFTIAMGDIGNITIDADALEAYSGGTLRNRLVTGDYTAFSFAEGTNTITKTGTVSRIDIENYSRWL